MNIFSRWFWKRAIRHEMLSIARVASLAGGLLLVFSALVGAGPMSLGLILGVGIIILSGRLKRRLWSAGFLVGGVPAFSSFDGIVNEGGLVLTVVAAALGLGSALL